MNRPIPSDPSVRHLIASFIVITKKGMPLRHAAILTDGIAAQNLGFAQCGVLRMAKFQNISAEDATL